MFSYNGATVLVHTCHAGAKFAVSRGQRHVKPPYKNNSPKLPLAMQIQSVSVDCVKEEKEPGSLNGDPAHPVLSLWLISEHASPHCSCSNPTHCPGFFSNFSPCHSDTMPRYQQLCYGGSTVRALPCQHRLRPCYRN